MTDTPHSTGDASQPPSIVRHVPALAAAVAGESRPVILIDGRSGSGKTTLAHALAREITGSVLIRLDDLYPGWDGLDDGSAMVTRDILRPNAPGWRQWDWHRNRPGPWHPIDPSLPLIVEGCGALSREARTNATLGVWVELDPATRRRRALARDGETYAPHWERWARQEDEFIAREQPAALADITIVETPPGAFLTAHTPT